MEVKIYREKENENLIIDENQLSEYNELAKELGIQSPEEKKESKTPIVYPYMNSAMTMLFHTLCPMKSDVKDYKKSTIPLEVLRVFKFAKDNEMFEGFQIWYNDVDPDPLLVGWKYTNDDAREKKYSWMKDRYLIARWGDCAMEIPELLKEAKRMMTTEFTNNAIVAKDTLDSMLRNPEAYVEKILSNNSVSINIGVSAQNTIY